MTKYTQKTTMGRASFKAGGLFAQNIQAGSFDLTMNGSGDGTTTVTLAKAMKSTPKVILTSAEQITTGVLSHARKNNVSFQAKVDGCNLTSDVLTVDYIAFDDSYN